MRCTLGLDENWELVVGYAARTLDPRTQASFEQHLKSCQACSKTVAVHQAVWDALDESQAVSVSPDFDRKLQARIAHQQVGWWLRSWYAAVPVAAACVVFGVSLWLNHPQRVEVAAPALSQVQDSQQLLPQPSPQPPPQPPPQVDKLEHALDDMDMLGQLSAGNVQGKAGSASPI
jgi:hypothetical protein